MGDSRQSGLYLSSCDPGTFYRQTGYVTVKLTSRHGQHCIIRAVCRASRAVSGGNESGFPSGLEEAILEG